MLEGRGHGDPGVGIDIHSSLAHSTSQVVMEDWKEESLLD